MFCSALWFLSGCVRQHESDGSAPQTEALTYTSGSLHLPDHADAPRVIYVEARNSDGQSLPISKNLQAALAAEHFRIVDSPSEAGYILNIKILQRGKVDPANLGALTQAGYGSPARFMGTGGVGMLVDALLVQRRVPSASKPANARLKNISARNAMESAQMRLGAVIPRSVSDQAAAYDALSVNLARALRAALAGGTNEDNIE